MNEKKKKDKSVPRFWPLFIHKLEHVLHFNRLDALKVAKIYKMISNKPTDPLDECPICHNSFKGLTREDTLWNILFFFGKNTNVALDCTPPPLSSEHRTDWRINWLTDLLIDWLTDLLKDGKTVWLTDCLYCILYGRQTDLVRETSADV